MSLADDVKAAGEVRAFLDAVEVEGRRHGVTVRLSDGRRELARVLGHPPAFGGWLPRDGGGVEGRWLGIRQDGASVGKAGCLAYHTGPLSLASFVNGGGLWRETDNRVRMAGPAAQLAGTLGGLVGFSGNYWLAPSHRKSPLSAWLLTVVHQVNAALAESLYGPLDVVAGFVREDQVRHLAPGYRFDVLAAGVVWHYDHGPDVPMRLGVQSPASLQDVLRELSAKVAA